MIIFLLRIANLIYIKKKNNKKLEHYFDVPTFLRTFASVNKYKQ